MYDAILIGSCGGAVVFWRLAEKGLRVLVLERRRQWWTKANYPTKPGGAWIWSNSHPEQLHGWLDLRAQYTQRIL
jgi:choline dehydrogenase-like flavoprotein